MYKWLLTMALCWVVGNLLPAQRLDNDLESLISLPEDSTRVVVLNRVSEALAWDFADSSLNFASKAMALSRKLNYLPGVAEARLNQARATIAKNDLDNASASLKICKSEFAQLQDGKGLAACALLDARIALGRQLWNLALNHCYQADSLYGNDSLPWSEPEWLRGTIFRSLGSLEVASEYFGNALRLATAANDVRGKAVASQDWADVLLALGRNEEALDQQKAAFEAWKLAGDRYGQMAALTGAGSASVRSGKPEGGRKYIESAIALALEDRVPERAGVAFSRLAEAEVKLGQPDSAQRHFYAALAILRNLPDPAPALDARIGVVQAALIRNDPQRAFRHGDTAVAIADSFHLYKPLATIHILLSKAWQTQGDFRQALEHYQQAGIAKDSLQRLKERNIGLAMQVKMTYQADMNDGARAAQAQANSEGVRTELGQTRTGLWITLAALVICLGLLLYLLTRLRAQRRKVAHLLRQKNEELGANKQELVRVSSRLEKTDIDYEALIAERTESLQEAVESLIAENEALESFMFRISNDLLGPVARLKGIVQIAKTSGQVKDFVQAIDLIDAVSNYMDKGLHKLILIHEVKHGFKEIVPVNLEEMILDIRPDLKAIPGVKFPDIKLDDRLKRPVMVEKNLIKVILENLMENACIFRKDLTNDSPRIDILLQKEDEDICIVIRDEGVGIPNEIRDKIFNLFFRGSERSKGSGLGLYLVQRALREINGRIQVESKEGAFTQFLIRFKEVEH